MRNIKFHHVLHISRNVNMNMNIHFTRLYIKMFACPIANVSMKMAGIKIWATVTRRVQHKHNECKGSVWLLAYILKRWVQINKKTKTKTNYKKEWKGNTLFDWMRCLDNEFTTQTNLSGNECAQDVRITISEDLSIDLYIIWYWSEKIYEPHKHTHSLSRTHST